MSRSDDVLVCMLRHIHSSPRAAAECGHSAYKAAMTVIQDALWKTDGWRERARNLLTNSGFRTDAPSDSRQSVVSTGPRSERAR